MIGSTTLSNRSCNFEASSVLTRELRRDSSLFHGLSQHCDWFRFEGCEEVFTCYTYTYRIMKSYSIYTYTCYMHTWSQNKYIAQPCTACESYFLCKVCMNQYLGVVPSIFSNLGRQPLTMRHTEHVFLNKHESISGDTVDGKKSCTSWYGRYPII